MARYRRRAVIPAPITHPVVGAHDDLHLNDAAPWECFKHRVDTVLLPILIGSLGGGLRDRARPKYFHANQKQQ